MKLPIQAITNLYRNALRNPKYRWGVILATLIYLISPIDIAPDLIPLLGQIDDIALLLLFLTSITEAIAQWMDNQKRDREASGTSPNTDSQTIDVDAVSLD
ncbi:YkvA family protein [Phormidium sp. CCY1219]|uniref:YkvA family protein n=1 Tax=Phormidium sp. CCY1219 TaxID=2886104 RepID=UPI002D1F9662|nr:DUF1232 domain-containing protein [Phormidium sp. CCY1219]MEB3831039.1 DUF1232 domain-containing protein [Phormidium sp. CCY1219]